MMTKDEAEIIHQRLLEAVKERRLLMDIIDVLQLPLTDKFSDLLPAIQNLKEKNKDLQAEAFRRSAALEEYKSECFRIAEAIGAAPFFLGNLSKMVKERMTYGPPERKVRMEEALAAPYGSPGMNQPADPYVKIATRAEAGAQAWAAREARIRGAMVLEPLSSSPQMTRQDVMDLIIVALKAADDTGT